MDKLHELAKDYFQYSEDFFTAAKASAKEIVDFNHNKHYTISQLNTLRNRRQPAETFNVIKSYKRTISGYLASTISNINVKPVGVEDVEIASLGQDIVQYTLRISKFNRLKIKLFDDLLLTGLCGIETRIDNIDENEKQIKLMYIPYNELSLDPKSREEDYSDARFIHKYRWLTKETVLEKWPNKEPELSNASFANVINDIDDPENTRHFYKMSDTYLVIASYIKHDNKIWEVIWSGNTLLEKNDITHYNKFPIRPIILEKDNSGFYSIFREVLESQKAINQALINIQMLVNVNKVYVNKNAIDDIAKFTELFNRVNSIIEMKDINGVRIDNLNGDVIAQYTIIDKSLERIKRTLNLNDSFLGMMGSSASGRQVKLQQNMTASALNYITSCIEYMYECIGEDILSFAKIFYTNYKILRIADKRDGDKFVEINKPFLMPNLQTGQMEPVIKNIDYDKDGNANIEYWLERKTNLKFLKYDIEVTTANYNETDDLERIQLDSIIQGPAGQYLMNADPSSYGKVIALSMKAMKTRNSEYIAEIFENVANKLNQTQILDPRTITQQQPNSATGPGEIMSAIGMTNDAKPEGYNKGKQ